MNSGPTATANPTIHRKGGEYHARISTNVCQPDIRTAAIVFVLVLPPLQANVGAFACCIVEGTEDYGCMDTAENECTSDGECHSEDPKSCDVGVFSCGWENDGGCAA